MVLILLVGLLTLAVFVSQVLLKAYTSKPIRELKRQARSGDRRAVVVYRAAAFGLSLKVLLWLVTGLAAAELVVLCVLHLPILLAVLACSLVIWVAFAWLPNTRTTVLGENLAVWAAPMLIQILHYAHPVLERVGLLFTRQRGLALHTDLYQKEDILELIKRQHTQVDNRIDSAELDIIANTLTFGEKMVSSVMTPRRVVKMVNTKDIIGPVLLDELHTSGFSRFPVYQDKPDHIVGTLYLRDLVDNTHGGRVKDHMSKLVYYVHEEDLLGEVLQAFFKTKHHLFIVVNSFEEVVGVITIEDVLAQILGKPILNEFDQYDDLRAVASRQANKEREKKGDKVIE